MAVPTHVACGAADAEAFDSLPGIAGAIVNRIGGSAGVVLAVERRRVARAPPADPDPWDHYVLGSDATSHFARAGSLRAVHHLRAAVVADPRFARAWCRLAAAYLTQLACTCTDDAGSTAGPDLANLRRAMAMNPCYPAWYSLAFGYCAYHAGAFRDAIEELSKTSNEFLDKQLYLCLCHAELGEADDVRRHRSLPLELNPAFSTAGLVAGDLMSPAAATRVRASARAARLSD